MNWVPFQCLVAVISGLYALATWFYLADLLRGERKIRWKPAYFVEGGFLIHTLAVFAYPSSPHELRFHLPSATAASLPLATVGEASSFFAWSLAFVYLILVRRIKTEGFGLILAPVLILFLIPAFFPFQPHSITPAYVHDTYFLIHILSAFFGYASFGLSFIAGALYLVQDYVLRHKIAGNIYHKLASLEDLERLLSGTILWGVVLMGGAIVTGALWAKSAFGSYFLWEPKSFASILTWCAYVGIIYLHRVVHVKGKRVVRMSVGAFLLVLITFWGTSIFQEGLHVGIW